MACDSVPFYPFFDSSCLDLIYDIASDRAEALSWINPRANRKMTELSPLPTLVISHIIYLMCNFVGVLIIL